MLKFFRKIRQNLLKENHFSKYLLYAIGEILLVVIGILIAVQINNWNEQRQDAHRAQAILKGLKNDMLQDKADLDFLQERYQERLAYFKKVDPSFEFDLQGETIDDTTRIFDYLVFRLKASFRAKTSTYDAMVAEGHTRLITNKKLFSQIQRIYKRYIPAHLGLFENLRTRQREVAFKWSHVKRYKPYKYIREVKDEHLIADLNYYHDGLAFYYDRLIFFETQLDEVIVAIEQELQE